MSCEVESILIQATFIRKLFIYAFMYKKNEEKENRCSKVFTHSTGKKKKTNLNTYNSFGILLYYSHMKIVRLDLDISQI